jgi:glycosyltransferase involved in cell wall biosynthesis
MTPAARAHPVLLVTPNLDVGGAQENLRTMAQHLASAARPVVVCTFADGPVRSDLERAGVRVEILPGRRHPVTSLPLFLLEMYRTRRRLVALVRRHGIGVVQTRGLGTLDFLVMTLRRSRGVQVWWTIENVEFMVRAEHLGSRPWMLAPKRAAHRLLYRAGARLVDGIVAVSNETEDSFRRSVGYRGDRLHVVPNGADVDRFPAACDRAALRRQLGLRPTDHVMTMVGTFKRQKGHRHLIDAMRSVAPRLGHLHLLLVGDGELRPETSAAVARAGLSERVHFLGTRRDVAELLAASDSFVLPSLWEGLPVALVEAMASALPIVATDVSGTRDVMVDGETGWIVPPGDAAALADAIADLVTNPQEAATRARAARARVEAHFSAQAQARMLTALFDRRPAGPAPRLASEPVGAR